MKKRIRFFRAIHIISLILSVMFVSWCCFCLIFDVEHIIEWIIWLLIEITVSIPGSVSALQVIRRTEEKQREESQSNNVMTNESQPDN